MWHKQLSKCDRMWTQKASWIFPHEFIKYAKWGSHGEKVGR